MIDLAETIAAMKESGLDDAAIVAALACLRLAPATAPTLTARQARNKRYYKAKASEKRLKASELDVSDAIIPFPKESPQTPKETPLSQPTTPKEKTPKGVQKKAVRLPADWQMPPDWRQDAIDQGLPPQRIDREAAQMLDWSRSSPNGAKLDWRAAWRNWCRKAAERLTPNRGPPSRPIDDLINSMVSRMDEADADPTTQTEGYPAATLRLSRQLSG